MKRHAKPERAAEPPGSSSALLAHLVLQLTLRGRSGGDGISMGRCVIRAQQCLKLREQLVEFGKFLPLT